MRILRSSKSRSPTIHVSNCQRVKGDVRTVIAPWTSEQVLDVRVTALLLAHNDPDRLMDRGFEGCVVILCCSSRIEEIAEGWRS
jgi:hypothetical protein